MNAGRLRIEKKKHSKLFNNSTSRKGNTGNTREYTTTGTGKTREQRCVGGSTNTCGSGRGRWGGISLQHTSVTKGKSKTPSPSEFSNCHPRNVTHQQISFLVYNLQRPARISVTHFKLKIRTTLPSTNTLEGYELSGPRSQPRTRPPRENKKKHKTKRDKIRRIIEITSAVRNPKRTGGGQT